MGEAAKFFGESKSRRMRKLARHGLGGGGSRSTSLRRATAWQERKRQEIFGRCISTGYPKPTKIVKRGFFSARDGPPGVHAISSARPAVASYLVRLQGGVIPRLCAESSNLTSHHWKLGR